jgi:hypothetical protein
LRLILLPFFSPTNFIDCGLLYLYTSQLHYVFLVQKINIKQIFNFRKNENNALK